MKIGASLYQQVISRCWEIISGPVDHQDVSEKSDEMFTLRRENGHTYEMNPQLSYQLFITEAPSLSRSVGC